MEREKDPREILGMEIFRGPSNYLELPSVCIQRVTRRNSLTFAKSLPSGLCWISLNTIASSTHIYQYIRDKVSVQFSRILVTPIALDPFSIYALQLISDLTPHLSCPGIPCCFSGASKFLSGTPLPLASPFHPFSTCSSPWMSSVLSSVTIATNESWLYQVPDFPR